MQIDELDKLLQAVKLKREAATNNILELQDNDTYKSLVAKSRKKGALTGVTEVRVAAALGALDEMWSVFPLLTAVLDRANDLRTKIPKLFPADEIQAIVDLLKGPSVKITVQTPFAQRDLYTPSESTTDMTPERVFELMVSAFKKARDLVTEVEKAQDEFIPKLADVVRETEELRKLATALGESGNAELTLVDQKVEELKKITSSDPLGVQTGFESAISPLLDPIRTHLQKVGGQRQTVEQDLATARTLLAQLEESHTKAKAAAAERELKVTVDQPETIAKPLSDSVIDGDAKSQALKPWLTRLEATFATNWKAASVGVASWLMQARQRLEASEKAVTENTQPLDERRELRGRLESYKVMAARQGLGEDQALAAIAREAHALLFSRPTPLAKARELVRQYQQGLK